MSETTQPRTYDAILRWLPAVQWLFTIIIAAAVIGLSFRDSQTSQAAQIIELKSKDEQITSRMTELKTMRDKQMDELSEKVATKQNLQDKFETLLKLQELTREDVKQLRESIERSGR